MTYLYKIMAAGLLLFLSLCGEAEDISTVTVEKDGKVVETAALPAPTAGEGWIPKKVKRQSSLQEENPDIRSALISYFADSTMDSSDMSYTCSLVDLDGDGKEEALVLLSGPDTDKDGSPMLLILRPSEEGWMVGQEIMGFPGTLFIPERGKKAGPVFFRFTLEPSMKTARGRSGSWCRQMVSTRLWQTGKQPISPAKPIRK